MITYNELRVKLNYFGDSPKSCSKETLLQEEIPHLITFWADVTGHHYRSTSKGIDIVVINDADTDDDYDDDDDDDDYYHYEEEVEDEN